VSKLPTPRRDPFSNSSAWRYGLMGLPLAFVALPLYVVLPNYYAREWGLSLSAVGSLLLAARLLDALTDPLLGRWVDRLFARSAGRVLQACGAAAVLLALGFVALFFPYGAGVGGTTPAPGTSANTGSAALWTWLTIALIVTYAAYSFLTIAHQSWAAQHGGSEVERSRLMGWREGLALVGVLVASVLPLTVGMAATSVALAMALAVAWVAWRGAPRPQTRDQAQATQPREGDLLRPWASTAFRRLVAVFMLGGIASAIPATLVLFFIQDRLRADAAWQPVFLIVYFVCAALAVPLWMRAVKRWGLAVSWLLGMVLAMAVFAGASPLQAGDNIPFLLICALSGAALGADLALPSALLTGVIAQMGDTGRAEGAYFGWWNFASKLNLALSAGLVLPALAYFGYTPGTQDPQALEALAVAYCAVPCALKTLAAICLYRFCIRQPTFRKPM
jgi:glycoside/pentoside/hexuronide:cation symporter, GPH family